MKHFILTIIFFIACASYSQELKQKEKERKELKKELKKKKSNLKEVKNLKLKNKVFNLKKSSVKSQKEIYLQQLQKLRFQQKIEFIQQKSVIGDLLEFGKELKVPELSDDIKKEEGNEELESLVSDHTRLKGPTQFDSRIEVRKLNGSIDWQWLILQRKKSVGLIIDKKQLKILSKDIFQLDISNTLKETYNICKEEPFVDQPIIGVGSSFIIDSDIMLTANHVLTKSLDNYAVVFGYELINKNGIVESIIPSKNIYYIKEIIKSSKTLDFITFRVDRDIKDRLPLKWKLSSSLKKGDEIYMIGHPSGLPKKIALNASILENNHYQYFYTTLDSFQGNSGSPVFDFASHRVIGVLVSGELDYKFNGNCYESTLCKIPYCKGEKVIRIENILNN